MPTLIIAGSRNVDHCQAFEAINKALQKPGFVIDEVVSGCARGVDTVGEDWARMHAIPVKQFPGDWKRYGRRAGVIRNIEMAQYADRLLAVWDGKSPGTGHMIRVMKILSKPVQIVELEAK